MTGLIYVVIIALWAAVLIPMWLRRHDQISEVRSTARFSSAMRSLGGQGQPQYAMESGYDMDEQYVLPTTRSSSPVPEARAMRPTTDSRPPGMDPSYERELASQAASMRRAVVLGSFTFILLLALVLAMLGMFPRWAPVLAAIPVVGFVLAAAMTASERSAAQPVRKHRAERTPRAPRAAEAQVLAQAQVTPAPAVVDDWETWNAWDDDESWDAVPTTLPTYVTAPRASQVPRGIDRSRPGEWTGEAMVETAQSMRSRSRGEPLERPPVAYGSETAEIPVVKDGYDSRRAVNE